MSIVTTAAPTPQPTWQNALPLQTLTDAGKPPKSRLGDGSDARCLVNLLERANIERNQKWAMVKGMLDGNPPFNQAKLRANSEAWRSNFNTLTGKARHSQACAPYYDLFSDVPLYATMEAADGVPVEAAEIVAQEWDRALKEWEDFEPRMQRLIYDFVGFGRGYMNWPQPRGWECWQVPFQNLLVPDGAKADPGKLETFIIIDSYPVHTLWEYIKDEKAAEAIGWDVAAVKDAILGAVPDLPLTYRNWMAVQQLLKDSDIYLGCRAATVQVGHVYVKEFDGTWTHAIVNRSLPVPQDKFLPPTQPGTAPGPQHYLFMARSGYSELKRALAPFFFEIGDGSWNGLSGIGKDLFPHMQVYDRLKNKTVDGAFLRAGILLQAGQGSNLDDLSLMQVGGTTIIPDGLTVQSSTVMGDIASPMAVAQDLARMTSENTGIYVAQVEQQSGNPRSATEASLIWQNATVLSSSAMKRFYGWLDRFYGELYRRCVEDALGPVTDGEGRMQGLARAFAGRCVARGVMPQWLPGMRVMATRNTGHGSVQQRQQASAFNLQLLPMLPESGKRAVLADAVAAYNGFSAVKRYLPQEQPVPGNDEWQAVTENAVLKDGSPVLLTDGQDDITHLQAHLAAGSQAANLLAQSQAQGGPVDAGTVVPFLDAIGQHSAQHLQRLEQNPTKKQQAAILGDQWKQLAKVTDGLRAQAHADMANQQKARAISQGLDPETQVQAATAAAKVRLQGQKQQAKLVMDQQRHEQQQQLADASTAADIERQNAVAAADIRTKHIKAEADAEAKRIKASQRPPKRD